MAREIWSDSEKLETCSCWCGMPFAVPSSLMRIHKRNVQHSGQPGDASIVCPAGHRVQFGGETEAQKLRKELDRERQRRMRSDEQLDHERNSHRTTRGHMTRLRKRVGRGVCPCCNRTFANVARHIESKHPDFAESES